MSMPERVPLGSSASNDVSQMRPRPDLPPPGSAGIIDLSHMIDSLDSSTEDSFAKLGAPGNIEFSQMRPRPDLPPSGSAGIIDLSQMIDSLDSSTEDSFSKLGCAPGNIEFSQMRPRLKSMGCAPRNIDFSQMRTRPDPPPPPPPPKKPENIDFIQMVYGGAPGNIDFSQMIPPPDLPPKAPEKPKPPPPPPPKAPGIIDCRQEIPFTRGDYHIAIDAAEDESSKPYIFKVPDILRRHNPKSFTPNSFSFGPLHHAQEHLKAAEEIKKHYLHDLLSRKPTFQTTETEFKRSILEVEGRARKCYAFPTDHLKKEEFVDMLIRDGCFIIELLRKISHCTPMYNDDPVFSVSWIIQVLSHDLILLENQIPWFVLERLFQMTYEPPSEPLTKLALDFFGKIFSGVPLLNIEGSHKSNHILDLLRKSLVSSFGTGQELKLDWQLIPSATSLKESGIRFKTDKSSNLLDIKFVKHGVLKIPSLIIQETTCEILRNLISYEQCYPNCKPKITSYAILLNNFINTTKDIEVLHEARIVNNWLNPNDTLAFFKNLYTDTYVKEFYYNKICEEVNEYAGRLWPRARAAYVRNHFADPWVIVSQTVAGIVVILTFLQTLYTIKQS